MTEEEYTFLRIDGAVAEEYFLGPLPLEGQAVELVYCGKALEDGGLRLQLRTKV